MADKEALVGLEKEPPEDDPSKLAEPEQQGGAYYRYPMTYTNAYEDMHSAEWGETESYRRKKCRG